MSSFLGYIFGVAVIALMTFALVRGLRNPRRILYDLSDVPMSPGGLYAALTFVLALGACLVLTRIPYFRDSNRHSAWIVFPLMGVAVTAWVIGLKIVRRDKREYYSARRRRQEERQSQLRR